MFGEDSQVFPFLSSHLQPLYEKVEAFENTIQNKVNAFFPVKTFKKTVHDKPFVNADLKKLKRQKKREYRTNGISEKYRKCSKKFNDAFRQASKEYLNKSINDLKVSNPGKLYKMFKKLGARPGESEDDGMFTLPAHENMNAKEIAEIIAEHFSKISREYPPLQVKSLPERVRQKIANPESE